MPDFKNLTLSDFYNMELMTRDNGTITPIIDTVDGKNIGLAGYNADHSLNDLEIKEDAFMYYKSLIKELNKKLNQ